MNIAVVGTGYVGLVSGACFAEFGTHVTCVDVDRRKVDALNAGEIPIYEPGLETLVARNVAAGRLKFTCELEKAVADNLVVFVTVGTPQDPHGRADLSSVLAVAGDIANVMDSYKVIVVKSTVPVGTGDRVEALIRERCPEIPFSVASNPEFLREGAAIEDFMRPNRVVIGTEDLQSAAILEDLYRPLYLIETPILKTRRREAELIKYASNAFLAVKISYINEMADLCDELDVDVHAIARGMGLDRRIGAKFLHPGPGFGGSCFPKDTRAILATAEEYGAKLDVIESAVAVNRERAKKMVEKIQAGLPDGRISGRRFALLGLSFKPNTDDVRESPAMAIAERIIELGGQVRAFDPAAAATAKAAGFAGEIAIDEYDACRGADALIIATEWNQFRNLDLQRIKSALEEPLFFDLRNVYEPADLERLGFQYVTVGRGVHGVGKAQPVVGGES